MLQLNKISKIFPEFELKEISLNIQKGDYFVILGKSGSGKSLLLEIIAGITKPASGQLIYNDIDISKKPIQKRDFVLVYQNLALFPHLSVKDNILFALKCKKTSKSVQLELLEEASQFLSISHLLDRKPHNLSGGESQRVALARALVVNPHILLLDEPLSSLDVQLKDDLRRLLKKINADGQTIIHVTHDFEEAVSLAKHVAIIENGHIIQTGETDEVFLNPRNDFSAQLTGIKNFFKVSLVHNNNSETLRKMQVENSNVILKVPADTHSTEGYIAFHANDVFLSENKVTTTAVNNFEGIVTDIQKKHLHYEITIDIGIPILAHITKYSIDELKISPSKKIWLSFKASSVKFIENN